MKTPLDPWEFSQGPLQLVPKLPVEQLVGIPDGQPGLIESSGFEPFPAGSRSRWMRIIITHDDSMQIDIRYQPDAPQSVVDDRAADTPATPFAGRLEIRNGTFGEHETLIMQHLGSLFDVALLPES